MKRNIVVAVTALAAGLLLAVGALAAPFRNYERAAGDQYTTTTSTTSTSTSTTTVGATVTVSGQSTTSPTTPTDPGAVDGPSGTPTDADDENGEEGGAGAAPDEDAGAGSPTGGATNLRGTASGAGAGDGRGTIAVLQVGDLDPRLGGSVGRVIGLPAWSANASDLDVNKLGDAAAGTRFAGIGEGDLDLAKLQGFARLLGKQTVTATGRSTVLPNLLANFEGKLKPITGMVLLRAPLEDADERLVTDAFMRSFARGMVLASIPVVGVEIERSKPSSIAFFKKIKGASSVDNLGTAKGEESLRRLLAGAKPGHYGTRKGADASQAPTIAPAAASSTLVESSSGLSGSPLLVGLLMTLVLLSGKALFTVSQRRRA